jgi:predicted AAA+ superfamily ATPase
MLKRKIDSFLKDWKTRKGHKPLIIKGARQIGKTTSVRAFGKSYGSFIEINFLLEPKYQAAFKDGYDVENVLKQLSIINPSFRYLDHDTLIFFDEIQSFPDATTSLKSFALDGRYDVICSGSLLGVNYKKISSIAVGFKEDYRMSSLDFEEFLWALGYQDSQIADVYSLMLKLSPLPLGTYQSLKSAYEDYLFCGGMPEMVATFVEEKNFSNVIPRQNQLLLDYEDDITKYVEGLNEARVKNLYRHIPSQLAKENHKFQITKLGHGARSRDYLGCQEWLADAGIVLLAYNLSTLAFPFKGNEDPDNFRIYYADHSLLVASLDEESKQDLSINRNFGVYSGALFENLVGEALAKQDYDLYFYRNLTSTIELDFVLRVHNEIVPIEVKAKNGTMKSLRTVLSDKEFNISHGVKFADANIGYQGGIFTFPYFLSFLLARFFKETDRISW